MYADRCSLAVMHASVQRWCLKTQMVVFKNTCGEMQATPPGEPVYDVNLVTAFVPSETACFASSPGRTRRTAVWISRDESVAFLL